MCYNRPWVRGPAHSATLLSVFTPQRWRNVVVVSFPWPSMSEEPSSYSHAVTCRLCSHHVDRGLLRRIVVCSVYLVSHQVNLRSLLCMSLHCGLWSLSCREPSNTLRSLLCMFQYRDYFEQEASQSSADAALFWRLHVSAAWRGSFWHY
jgi:hypothetical protein